MKAYYNEFDPGAAAWLRQLIADGLITPGDVDDRSITDVQPANLVGYDRVHFFAGIGGWDLALTLAGWGDRPVWTGSCPCQPFSAAGKRKGVADERHLWPEFFRLIRECRPECVFGEQVSGALGWLDLVSADLEGEGYACGAVIVGAHSVGAPHIRQRLYWVAHPDAGHAERGSSHRPGVCGSEAGEGPDHHAGGRGEAGGVADASGVSGSEHEHHQGVGPGVGANDPAVGPWTDVEWLPCRDGKSRPTQPGLFPLAHGVPGRVGLLRGAGNAIVPILAAAFIEAYRDARGE